MSLVGIKVLKLHIVARSQSIAEVVLTVDDIRPANHMQDNEYGAHTML